MGKSLPFTGKLQELTKIASSHQPKRSKVAPLIPLRPRQVRVDSQPLKVKKMEDSSLCLDGLNGVPLSQVVSLCAKRWFQDTLREANAGDIAMQVLVGQMYYSGYGVQKNAQKGCEWINRASKSRASVWKVSDKHPGYNASDSDSDEAKREANNSR
ncbi:hypothetical protein P3X46_014454 [Hevea brasiliensis]|uniref:Uncharacterized protein n=1 Tax=Hevea brasiliensis TaxID=3981 RepID=A0ABQ9M962_HEVBR|nr:uncharacterized protein LOC131182390 [Hevea brasiliensis]XP_058007828.1 uncharacterized protein LOC131182390 [Hevea brasiliensis]KAJ9175955.1 hypothetical protein P3X46_014454 [Hevea brasiliensis]